jgi:hypothetical protein
MQSNANRVVSRRCASRRSPIFSRRRRRRLRSPPPLKVPASITNRRSGDDSEMTSGPGVFALSPGPPTIRPNKSERIGACHYQSALTRSWIACQFGSLRQLSDLCFCAVEFRANGDGCRPRASALQIKNGTAGAKMAFDLTQDRSAATPLNGSVPNPQSPRDACKRVAVRLMTVPSPLWR